MVYDPIVGTLRTYIALSANHFVAVVLAGQGLEGGFDDTTTEAEDKVKGRFLHMIQFPVRNSSQSEQNQS